LDAGVGAQTLILAQRSPETQFTSIDISAESVREAQRKAEVAGLTNVTFEQADIFALPYKPESFDDVFVCFVLEHLARPREALAIFKEILRPGGTLTVFEGDHASTFFYPENVAAHSTIEALVKVQAQTGGDALIGRQLYPLIAQAGFQDIRVSPRMVYVDKTRPDLADAFTRKTFIAMIQGIRENAIAADLVDAQQFDEGITGLRRAAEPDGVFCYTFFKAIARKVNNRASPE
jgi:SAM-dependent methyltransferase